MTMRALTSIVLLLVISSGILYTNAQEKLYATITEGAEIIDLDKPILGYASNLLYTDVNGVPELYFTADKGVPNLYSASFNPNDTVGTSKSFWSNERSPLTGSSPDSAPFVTFNYAINTIIGASYPTRSVSDHSQLLIQSAYLPRDGSATTAQPNPVPNFEFYSFVIDPVTDPNELYNYVYAAGWYTPAPPNTGGFVVVRGHLAVNSTSRLAFIFDDNLDVSPLFPQNITCYDLYNEVSHPKLWLHNGYVLVALPGRCGFVGKYAIPPISVPPKNWGSVVPQTRDLVESMDAPNTKFVTSFAFDPETETFFYTTKAYFAAGDVISSLNTSTWTLYSAVYNLVGMDQSQIVLVVGNDRSHDGAMTRYLYVASSGANVVERFIVTAQGFSSIQYAPLSPIISSISSAVYVSPFLYYTTWESNAKLVRIARQNFCFDNCGNNTYCDDGNCKCRAGFSKDPNNNAAGCTSTLILNIENEKKESQGAAAALGVLFAFALVAAIAGWFLWYRSRRDAYKSLDSNSTL